MSAARPSTIRPPAVGAETPKARIKYVVLDENVRVCTVRGSVPKMGQKYILPSFPIVLVCRSDNEVNEALKLAPAIRRVFDKRLDQVSERGRMQIAEEVVGGPEMQSVSIPTRYFYPVLFGENAHNSHIFFQWSDAFPVLDGFRFRKFTRTTSLQDALECLILKDRNMSPPEELLGTTPYDDSGPVSGPTYDFSALTNAIANVDLSAILTSNSPPGSSSAPVLRRNVSEAAAYRQPSASAALSVTAGGLPPSHTYATEVILRVQKNPGPSGSQGYDATQRSDNTPPPTFGSSAVPETLVLDLGPVVNGYVDAWRWRAEEVTRMAQIYVTEPMREDFVPDFMRTFGVTKDQAVWFWRMIETDGMTHRALGSTLAT